MDLDNPFQGLGTSWTVASVRLYASDAVLRDDSDSAGCHSCSGYLENSNASVAFQSSCQGLVFLAASFYARKLCKNLLPLKRS